MNKSIVTLVAVMSGSFGCSDGLDGDMIELKVRMEELSDIVEQQTSLINELTGLQSGDTSAELPSLAAMSGDIEQLQVDVGVNTGKLDSIVVDISNIESDIETLFAASNAHAQSINVNSNQIQSNSDDLSANSQTLAGVSATSNINANAIAANSSDITAIESDLVDVNELMDFVTVDTTMVSQTEYADITFSHSNVRVESGNGSSTSAVNGYGNLIVGYNESDPNGSDHTGSHNIVLGYYNNYSSYGGIIAGRYNTVSAARSSVLGGEGNEVTYSNSVIVTGYYNSATGSYSAILGGYNNSATGSYSTLLGGYYNSASGSYSTLAGGNQNSATGAYSSILGGRYNESYGNSSAVAGGYNGNSSGQYSSVLGGYYNTSSGSYSAVLGGNNNTASGTTDTSYQE
jgi:hypothetical protein